MRRSLALAAAILVAACSPGEAATDSPDAVRNYCEAVEEYSDFLNRTSAQRIFTSMNAHQKYQSLSIREYEARPNSLLSTFERIDKGEGSIASQQEDVERINEYIVEHCGLEPTWEPRT